MALENEIQMTGVKWFPKDSSLSLANILKILWGSFQDALAKKVTKAAFFLFGFFRRGVGQNNPIKVSKNDDLGL